MFKKIIALFTCLCLTLSVTACTGSNGNNKLSKTEAQASVLDNYRTFYEVFVYSFCDSNGDGIGDLNGVTSKLDYIQDMGFTGIWLMPIMPSTTYHKYDVIDYESIDSQYGTMADFDNLIAECEKRNINVIIDLVLNHTSTQHKWFLSAKADENSEYRDYYNFEKEKPAGGKYYKTDKGFYEAMFWEGMPDLNLANVNLRKELENIMSFWLNKGVSGFRLDAAKEFYSGLPEKNIEVLTWVNDYCKSVKKDCYIVGEVWEDLEICAPYYKSGIDSFFNFSQASASGKIAKTILLDGEENTAQSYAKYLVSNFNTIKENNQNGIDANFFTNHDSPRAAGFMRRDEKLIKFAWGMNMMTFGNAFLYYGEELGMSGSGKDENKRAPMLWSKTDKTGMTNGPLAMEKQENSFDGVDIQLKDENSILNYIKHAVYLRNSLPSLSRGEPIFINGIADSDIAVIQKSYKTDKSDNNILIVYQCSDTEKTLDVNEIAKNIDLKGKISLLDALTTSNSEKIKMSGETLTLPPYSIAILTVF